MAWLTGREVKMALKKATTWRTAVECGAEDGILITSEDIGAKDPTYVDDDSLGRADVMCTVKVMEGITGRGFEGYLRYENWDLALALILGTAGTPVAQEATSTAYANVYYCADNLADIFGTLAMEKAQTTYGVWEVPSAKLHGFTISGTVGELAKVEVELAGNKIENQSAINTSTTMANVTYPIECGIAKMDANFYVWMNAQDGAALQSSDAIYPHSFSVKYSRPVDEPYGAGNIDMDEPAQDGFAEAMLEMSFDKYNMDTYMDAIEADSEFKMIIGFEGEDIVTGEPYKFEIYLPRIQFRTAESPVSGPGKIPHNVTGKLMAVTTAPTGMESTDDIGIDVVDPVAIRVVNTVDTSPLA